MRTFFTPIILGIVLWNVCALADPQLTSWLTTYSAQYARAYTNTTKRTSGSSVTTWSGQSLPVYADVPFVANSTSWVYVRAADLPSYVIGPWLNPQGQPGTLYPANQQLLNRFPRSPSVQSGTKTISGTGFSGLYVNGVAVFNFTDGKAWDPTNLSIVSGPHNKATYYWHRNAPVGEGFNFDYALGHQNPAGVYHTHQEPIALRYELGDHVDYNSSTKNYSESASTPTNHSSIIGWAYDGYPIYGPYGYSVSNDASSGIRRMVSGYVARNGQNGTDDLTNNVTTIPDWYARFRTNHFNATYSTTTTQARPSPAGTNYLGTFAEDYDYYGDITNPATSQLYVMGTNTFDLDVYNGRWCVTPEFPGGTYAYFLDIDSNGTPTYPYAIAYEYYGAASGGSVSSISEPVTTNFIGSADSALTLDTPTANSNYVVTLVWSSTEGGKYEIDDSTNQANWTVEQSNVAATVGVSTTNNYTSGISNGTVYVRVTRAALAGYDPVGFESGVTNQVTTNFFMIGNNAPTAANPIPDQTATYGGGFSFTFASNTFTDVDSGQTLTYTASSSALTNTGIFFDGSTRTFSATTIDATNGGTVAGSYTVNVIATDDGTPVMSATNSFTLTINRAAASVTADSFTRVYGSTNPIFTGTLSNFVAADGVTANYSVSAGTNQGAGSSIPIKPTLNDPNSVLGNYLVTTNNGTLTITDAVLTVTALNTSRSYGTASSLFVVSYSGFVNGQTLANSGVSGEPIQTTSATTNSPVGNYTITNSVGTLRADNYSFSMVNGTLTVTTAGLLVAVSNATRAYGVTNPVFTGSISGLVNNDSITANYSTTATTNSPPGNYPIVPTLNDPGSKLGNYFVETNLGTLTVTNTSTVISFNFTGTSVNNGTSSPMAASEVAGVLPVANWNNSTNQASGTNNALLDSSGVATPASITWNGTGIGTTAEGNIAGDDRMMKGYVDVTNGATGTITVTNLPGSISGGSYDVLVYFDGANGSADRNAEFTLGSVFFYGKDYTSYAGTYIQATTTNNNTISTPPANFVLFTNLTGSSFTVTATPAFASDSNPHAEFNGIQIIASSAAQTAVATNPASQMVCNGEPVAFTAAAQSASVLSVQWQVETNGGSSFANIAGATNTTLTFTPALADSGNQYQAVFSGYLGNATTTPATLTVSALPDATITASTNVIGGSTGNTASGPAGAAAYAWTIGNGTITSATNLQSVTYTAGSSGSVTLGLTVANTNGCTAGNSVAVPILPLSAGLQSFTNFDSVISLATNVTKHYTFTDPSNGLSVVVAVTMTPYSASNAAPMFSLLDFFSGIPTHMAVDSGLNSGDGNWVDPFEGADFSASLVSASTGVLTNSIQFGVAGASFRSDQGYPQLGWTSSGTTSSFTPTNNGLYTLDTTLAALAGTNYSGHLRSQTLGLYQFNDASPIAGQSVVVEVTFDEGIATASAPSVGTVLFTNSQFQFSIGGTTGAEYIVQATANLSPADWVSVFTNTAPFTFSDTNTAAFGQRFYRVVAP